MDFAALPPEINSALMYAGPGSAPMLAASAAWDGLADELRSAATSYGSVILELADAGWQGPSSVAMASAAAPYVAWMHSTAARAEQAGLQAAAAAAAHEAAFAATVPPPLVAANRALLMTLVATNFLGINTPAIAATEAQYAEMWAQDAAAMYAYAASSTTASALTPLATAPVTTNLVGLAGGAIGTAVTNLEGAAQGLGTQAVTGLSAIPAELNAAGPSLISGFQSGIGEFAQLISAPFGQGAGAPGATTNPGVMAPMVAPEPAVRPAFMPATPTVPPMRVTPEMGMPARLAPSAAVGQATSIGGLSVPSGWTPASVPAAEATAVAPISGAPAAAPMMARSIPATTVAGMEMRASGAAELPRVSVLPRVVG